MARAIIDAVRAACSADVWSRGVELARRGAPHLVKRSVDELRFAVATGARPVPFDVHLWPPDEEWSCDCDSRAKACIHVCASVIALNQDEAGTSESGVSKAVAAGELAWLQVELRRTPKGLAIVRRLTWHGGDHIVHGSALSPVRGAPRWLPRPCDLELDEELKLVPRDAPVPRERVNRVWRALADLDDLTLDGVAIEASAKSLNPVARVEDQGDGFLVRLVRAEGIEEVFANGVVRRGAVLSPIGDGGLATEQRRVLVAGLSFGPDEVGRLVGELLPQLQSKVTVDVRTRRLPRPGVVQAPYVRIEIREQQGGLFVLPALVYGRPVTALVEGGRLVLLSGTIPIRDLASEERRIRELGTELGLSPGRPVEFHGERAVAMAERLAGRRDVQGDALGQFLRLPTLVPSVGPGGVVGFALPDGSMESQKGSANVDPRAVLEAWLHGEHSVRVAGRGMAPLPLGWLDEHGDAVLELLDGLSLRGSSAKAHRLRITELLAELGEPSDGVELGSLQALVDGFDGLPVAPLPEGARVQLRSYQQLGVNWIAFLQSQELGGILADDMGLGKTIQALCCLKGRCLVVAPTSVLHNWRAEAQRFRPDLRVVTYHGPGRRLPEASEGPVVVLSSYAILRLDREQLVEVEWDMVVLDEAQAIKNPDSQVAQAAHALRSRFRLTMTGTPVENRPEELWSQMQFVLPGWMGSRQTFRDEVASRLHEPRVAERLRARIRPFVLRRKKVDVLPDLPPRTDVVERCELLSKERELYDAVRAASRASVVEAIGAGRILEALESLLRLRQAACHPALVPGQVAETSSKVELLKEILGTIIPEGHRVLVFSQWTSFLDLVEPHLRAEGWAFLRLDGSTADRASVVERFAEPNGPPIFLLSLKAGGVGLNLTAADHVILLDPWWNPAVEDQAADRAHRIGQDRPVMVHRLVAADTVEERLLDLQQSKRELAEVALGGAHAGALDRSDLMAMLGEEVGA